MRITVNTNQVIFSWFHTWTRQHLSDLCQGCQVPAFQWEYCSMALYRDAHYSQHKSGHFFVVSYLNASAPWAISVRAVRFQLPMRILFCGTLPRCMLQSTQIRSFFRGFILERVSTWAISVRAVRFQPFNENTVPWHSSEIHITRHFSWFHTWTHQHLSDLCQGCQVPAFQWTYCSSTLLSL